MPAHLRPLPRCRTCSAPATQMLYNAANAPTGEYCEKHAKKALDKFQADSPEQRPAWRT
jgi:hypothetical protein